MSTEKTFTDFIILHEKSIMSKGIKSVENDITTIFERVSGIIDSEKELNISKDKFDESITFFKKILSQYDLYENI